MQFSSLWSIDRNLSGATTAGQSGPGSNVNDGIICIPQGPNITGTSPSDCLVSYPGYSLGESYPSAQVQSVYSIAPSDLASFNMIVAIYIFNVPMQQLKKYIFDQYIEQ